MSMTLPCVYAEPVSGSHVKFSNRADARTTAVISIQSCRSEHAALNATAAVRCLPFPSWLTQNSIEDSRLVVHLYRHVVERAPTAWPSWTRTILPGRQSNIDLAQVDCIQSPFPAACVAEPDALPASTEWVSGVASKLCSGHKLCAMALRAKACRTTLDVEFAAASISN